MKIDLNLERIISIILSIIFLAAAILKLSDVIGFVFDLVQIIGVSNTIALFLAILIVSIEFTIGLFLLINEELKLTSILAIITLSIFLIYLVFLSINSPELKCNCFGSLSLFNDLAYGIGRNILLILLSLYLYYSAKTDHVSFKKPTIIFSSLLVVFGIVNINAFGINPSNVEIIEVEEIKVSEIGSDIILVDARDTRLFEHEHISGAISIPYYGTPSHSEKLQNNSEYNFKEAKVVTYCDSQGCSLAEKLAHELSKQLGTKIYVLNGGIENWKSRHLPITTGQ